MIKNIFLVLSVIMAMVIFVLASMQVIAAPIRVVALILSGAYILLFCWVNEVEL